MYSTRSACHLILHVRYNSPDFYSSCMLIIILQSVLAVQNMEAEGTVPKAQEIEFKALTGSLSMMSKVLNDVLDL